MIQRVLQKETGQLHVQFVPQPRFLAVWSRADYTRVLKFAT